MIMKRILSCLILCFLCFYCYADYKENNKVQSDTTYVEKTIDRWVDSLSTRKFSDDSKKIKEDVKDLVDKTKKTIEKHTPEVKRMFKSIGDYFKR